MVERESSTIDATFETSTDGGVAVVVAHGELDMCARDAIRLALEGVHGDVVFDLRFVTFLDSSAIGVLVQTRNRLLGDGGDLHVRAPCDFIRRTLQVVGLGDWIV
jgi:anti-anti-sigma factor